MPSADCPEALSASPRGAGRRVPSGELRLDRRTIPVGAGRIRAIHIPAAAPRPRGRDNLPRPAAGTGPVPVAGHGGGAALTDALLEFQPQSVVREANAFGEGRFAGGVVGQVGEVDQPGLRPPRSPGPRSRPRRCSGGRGGDCGRRPSRTSASAPRASPDRLARHPLAVGVVGERPARASLLEDEAERVDRRRGAGASTGSSPGAARGRAASRRSLKAGYPLTTGRSMIAYGYMASTRAIPSSVEYTVSASPPSMSQNRRRSSIPAIWSEWPWVRMNRSSLSTFSRRHWSRNSGAASTWMCSPSITTWIDVRVRRLRGSADGTPGSRTRSSAPPGTCPCRGR